MKYYAREDGIRSRAMQFKGRDQGDEEVLWIITFLTEQGMHVNWVDAKATDEWYEDEDGYPQQVVIPEHLKIVREFGHDDEGNRVELGVDNANVGDYIVERDGEYYVMNGPLFESIYEEVEI